MLLILFFIRFPLIMEPEQAGLPELPQFTFHIPKCRKLRQKQGFVGRVNTISLSGPANLIKNGVCLTLPR
jgi:hypothetical protein